MSGAGGATGAWDWVAPQALTSDINPTTINRRIDLGIGASKMALKLCFKRTRCNILLPMTVPLGCEPGCYFRKNLTRKDAIVRIAPRRTP